MAPTSAFHPTPIVFAGARMPALGLSGMPPVPLPSVGASSACRPKEPAADAETAPAEPNCRPRDIGADSACKRKNDSAIDLSTWTADNGETARADLMLEVLACSKEPALLDIDCGSSTLYSSSASGPSVLDLSLHEEIVHQHASTSLPAAISDKALGDDASEAGSDIEDDSDASEFAPEGSGEDDEALDPWDSDYFEPGRIKRASSTLKRKAEGSVRQPKDPKSRKTSKKCGKELGLVTVAHDEFDIDGRPHVKFTYTNKGRETTHIMRIDVEDVVESMLTPEFKETYCVYPKALCSRNEYKGKRLLIASTQTDCNHVAWKLAFKNQDVLPSGQRGLLQRAVDVYRNLFKETKSRRVSRQVKNAHHEYDRTIADMHFAADPGPRAARRGRPPKFNTFGAHKTSATSPTGCARSKVSARSMSYDSVSSVESYDDLISDVGSASPTMDYTWHCDVELVSPIVEAPQPFREASVQTSTSGDPFTFGRHIVDPIPQHVIDQLRCLVEAGLPDDVLEPLHIIPDHALGDPMAMDILPEYFGELQSLTMDMQVAPQLVPLSPQELVAFDAIVRIPDMD
ncbi:hypothetical protein DFJ74DRAFT_643904 [Hyaloraphidium curvatum]|nr:hypothetical protein DFJ74DRAFT_643904 [Hyaloraphidium curvatum]